MLLTAQRYMVNAAKYFCEQFESFLPLVY